MRKRMIKRKRPAILRVILAEKSKARKAKSKGRRVRVMILARDIGKNLEGKVLRNHTK
jgi:hypothetical protein